MTAPEACAQWDLVGAEAAVGTLRRMLAEDRLPQALLLSGPPAVGKARLAHELACVLNHRAEGECNQCRRIRSGNHADVEVVSIAGLTMDDSVDHRHISIAQIRRLEMLAATHPYEGRRRVFILDPADLMTPTAADAFLKTLEEPPEFVTFILVTQRPSDLSATIRSRCTELLVPPLAIDRLTAWLEQEHGLDRDAATTLARMSRGRIGAALEALAEDDTFALRRAQIEEIERVCEQSRHERFKVADGLAGRGPGEPTEALLALEHWTAWWRDALRVAVGSAETITHRQHLEALQMLARDHRPADLVRFLLDLRRAATRLHDGANPRLTLDVLFTQIPTRRAATRAEART